MISPVNPVLWSLDGIVPRFDEIKPGHLLNVTKKGIDVILDLKLYWNDYCDYNEAQFEIMNLDGYSKKEKIRIFTFMRQISATQSLSHDKEAIVRPASIELSKPELFRKLTEEEYNAALRKGFMPGLLKAVISHGFSEEELKTLYDCFKKRKIDYIDVMSLLFFDLHETLQINNVNKFIKKSIGIDIAEKLIQDFFIVQASLYDGGQLFMLGIDITSQDRKKESVESFILLEDWSSGLKRIEEDCDKILENPELSNDLKSPIERIQKILKFLQRLITHKHREIFIEDVQVAQLRYLIFPGEDWKSNKKEKLLKTVNKFYQFVDTAYESFKVTIQDTRKSEPYIQSILEIFREMQQKVASQELKYAEVVNCNKKFKELLHAVEVEKQDGCNRVNNTSDKVAAKFADKQNLKPLEWREKQLLIYSNSQSIYHLISFAHRELEQNVFLEIFSSQYLTRNEVHRRINLSISYIREELQVSPNDLDNLMLPYSVNEEQIVKLKVIILFIRGKVRQWLMYMRKKLEKNKSAVDIISQRFSSDGMQDYSNSLEKIEPCFNEILDELFEFLETETLVGLKDFLQRLDPKLLKSNRVKWVEFFKNIVYNEIKEFLLCLMLPKYVRESFQNYGIVQDEGCMVDLRLIPFLNVQGIEEIIDEILVPLQSEEEISTPTVSEIPAVLELEEPKEELSLSVVQENTEPKLEVQSVPLTHKNKSKEKRQKGTAASASSNPILNPGKQPRDERVFHAGDTIRWVLRKLKEEGFLIEQVRGQTTGSHGIRIKDSEEGTPTTLVVGGSHKEIGSGTATNLNHLVAEKKSSSD